MERGVGGILVSVLVPDLEVGVVVGRGCRVDPAPAEMETEIAALVSRARTRADDESVRKAVRDMLRHGRYKPTGRGKPASEYLVQAAREDRFPRINNLVDINNMVSLESMLPISLIDLSRAGRDRFFVRRGREGESYVFNSAGQTIELTDLVVVARMPEDVPSANPVKDAMETKLTDASTEVMAVLYAPRSLGQVLAEASRSFARALERWGGARDVACEVLTGS